MIKVLFDGTDLAPYKMAKVDPQEPPNTTHFSIPKCGLFSWGNFELVQDVWHHIKTSHNPLGNESEEYDDGYDMSWWLRIHKWCYALIWHINR